MADDDEHDEKDEKDEKAKKSKWKRVDMTSMFEKLDIFNPKFKYNGKDLDEFLDEEEEEDLPLEDHLTAITAIITNIQNRFWLCRKRYGFVLKIVFLCIILILILAHFAYASYYFSKNNYPEWDWEKGYGLYLVVFCLILICVIIYLLALCLSDDSKMKVEICSLNFRIYLFKHKWILYVFCAIVLAIMVAYLIYDSHKEPERLIAFAGYILIILVALLFSKDVTRVKPRIVLCGIVLQFLLAIITIKVKLGRDVFRVIGDRITLFLDYTEMGARFVFGDTLTVETFTFAFRGLSTVYYLAACVSVLYYYNIVQNVVFCLGLVMSCILDTTIVESVNAAANIFFGITESPLLLKPYLYVLTPSEIHAVAASGFGSVAGTVLGLYVSFGARADHLIIGSVINPLSTLYMSKILYPEDEASQTTRSTMRMPESDAYNALDALASGAMNAVQMVLGIVANVMAFISIVVVINVMTEWFGERIGADGTTLEMMFSYALMPVSFLLGVPWKECYEVANLIATKTLINELVAYQKLGVLKNEGKLSKRSVAISTFAVFGFSNPGTIGIIVSAFYYLEPSQVENVVKSICRSFTCGILTCLSTACLVGIMLKESEL